MIGSDRGIRVLSLCLPYYQSNIAMCIALCIPFYRVCIEQCSC